MHKLCLTLYASDIVIALSVLHNAICHMRVGMEGEALQGLELPYKFCGSCISVSGGPVTILKQF